jgi:hypothetical protein
MLAQLFLQLFQGRTRSLRPAPQLVADKGEHFPTGLPFIRRGGGHGFPAGDGRRGWLVSGTNGDVVIALNQQALGRLRCPKQLVIVPGAAHLFEEPGTLEEVSRLPKGWFVRYLAPADDPSRPGRR